MNPLLIVVMKAPRPGQVKTRLGATMGVEGALAAYRRLLTSTLGRLASIAPVELRFSPDDAGAEIQPFLLPGWQAAGQGDGDLGERLERCFRDAFAAGHDRVVVIGSDCPYLTAADIHDAWVALEGCDLVLGPALDGGYWLIGLAAPQPGLFRGIAWSTSTVLAQTREKAAGSGLRVHDLRTLSDVDTETDWRKYQAAGSRGNLPR